MRKLLFFSILFGILFWLQCNADNEFSSILNAGVECGDTKSIVMRNSNKTLLVTQCDEPLPLNLTFNSNRITQFILEYNNMNKLTKEQFHGLSSVTHMRFYENNVLKMDENTLEGLKSLLSLTINEPHLTIKELHPSKQCKLEHLNLRLKIIGSELLSKLPKHILNITVEDTPVVNGYISIPNHLINLKDLRLKNCSVVYIKESNVTLSALEYVDLSHNKIEKKTWSWQKNPNLMTLILSYNKITSIEENDFKNLISLRVLQSDNNNIDKLSYNAFKTNMNLTRVDLSYNNLKTIELYYTEFHKYYLQGVCNTISSKSLLETRSPLKLDQIECLESHKNSQSMMYLIWILIGLFVILIIFSIIYFKCKKRKGVPTNLNETENPANFPLIETSISPTVASRVLQIESRLRQ